MTSEYVKFSNLEVVNSQKNFLQIELEVLNTLKSYRNYQRLKNEELLLKIALKTKVDQVLSDIYSLEKILPKTTVRPKKTREEENQITREIDLTLEDEINLLKQKIDKLK